MASSDRPTTPADVAAAIDSLVNQGGGVKVNISGSAGDTGIESAPAEDAAFRNPMNDYGQLIDGDLGGAPARVPAGTLGQVLTMTTVSGRLRPRFADATGGASTGLYRQPVYTTEGGGSLVWNAEGELLFDLQELE